MDLEKMFDDLFTDYSSLDPPPIKRDTDILNEVNLGNRDYLTYDLQNLNTSTAEVGTHFSDLQENSFSFQLETPQLKRYASSKGKENLKGPQSFEKSFKKALEIDPSIIKYKNFLVKTAQKESGFNSRIQNTAGAPYYGYFQMGKNEIAMTTKMSVEQFRDNPVAQILGACKLYEMNLKTIKRLGVYNLGKQKGYSDDALVAGAWLGGPGGVKKFLQGKGDPSDSHWYGGKGGTSVGKRMNEFNKYELV